MKKIIAMVLLAALLLTACGQPVTAEKTPQGGEAAQNNEPAQDGGNVQLANPWRACTEEEAKALCPHAFRVPEGAENAAWSVMEAEGQPALVQLSFDLNGMSYTARAQATNDKDADISGMYYTWTAQDEMTLSNWEDSAKNGSCFRYIGEEEWADLCTWYDTAKGISYSLSVTSKDLDGFDLQAIAEALSAAQAPAETGRQDGERFEATIILEGMEETVRYEHIRNDALGFEMDYDYELFVRQSGPDSERIISIYDDLQNPEDYLELTYRAGDAKTVAASVRETLSQEYDLLEDPRELTYAGSCLYIEAAVVKGTNNMADRLQMVYIIPTSDGCLVAAEHVICEAAEGFGRRFAYMLDTLVILDGQVK